MRVRHAQPFPELRSLPLDSHDMFILSRLEHGLSLVQLAEVAPCGLCETMERVRSLVVLGALDLFDDEEEEAIERVREQATASLSAPPGPPTKQPEATQEDEGPPTGLRMRFDLDAAARSRVLIGAVMLGRQRPRGAVLETAAPAKTPHSDSGR